MNITWTISTDDELRLRVGPLKQAWEARGAGLLRGVAQRIGASRMADEATVAPCLPQGGRGAVDHPSRTVRIEAVLVNPVPELPEVVRLGWLLARLNSPSDDDTRERVESLALIPPTLAAAEDVELARCDRRTLALALSCWMNVDDDALEAFSAALDNWWAHHSDTAKDWSTSVAELESYLRAEEVKR